MPAPELTYDWYLSEHRGGVEAGAATEDGFASSLPLARARLAAMVGASAPEGCEDAYRHALCAIVERVSGADASAAVASEHVGQTTVTYADWYVAAAGVSDWDLVRPWLAGTGLLSSCIDGGRVR